MEELIRLYQRQEVDGSNIPSAETQIRPVFKAAKFFKMTREACLKFFLDYPYIAERTVQNFVRWVDRGYELWKQPLEDADFERLAALNRAADFNRDIAMLEVNGFLDDAYAPEIFRKLIHYYQNPKVMALGDAFRFLYKCSDRWSSIKPLAIFNVLVTAPQHIPALNSIAEIVLKMVPSDYEMRSAKTLLQSCILKSPELIPKILAQLQNIDWSTESNPWAALTDVLHNIQKSQHMVGKSSLALSAACGARTAVATAIVIPSGNQNLVQGGLAGLSLGLPPGLAPSDHAAVVGTPASTPVLTGF